MRKGKKINTGAFPENYTDVVLNECSATYLQDADDADPEQMQTLKLSILHGDSDYFFVVETKRWAFDNVNDFINLLRDFEKKIK